MSRIINVILACLVSTVLFGQNSEIILNEYNAVDSVKYLNGGTLEKDSVGGKAADATLGRVKGNGGDWFELVIIKDHLDIRGWSLDIQWYNNKMKKTERTSFRFTTHRLWADLRSGTIVTIAEHVREDPGYDPQGGDWWINVMVHKDAGSGIYIEKKKLTVTAKNWQLVIRDASGTIKFGPSGEGISPAKGINDEEIFRLESDPSGSVAPDTTRYDSGKDRSTFGKPNEWSGTMQDFTELRSVVK